MPTNVPMAVNTRWNASGRSQASVNAAMAPVLPPPCSGRWGPWTAGSASRPASVLFDFRQHFVQHQPASESLNPVEFEGCVEPGSAGAVPSCRGAPQPTPTCPGEMPMPMVTGMSPCGSSCRIRRERQIRGRPRFTYTQAGFSPLYFAPHIKPSHCGWCREIPWRW